MLRLLAYWDHMRGERRLPAAEDIDVSVIGDDWPWCALLDAAADPGQYRFIYVGEHLRPADWVDGGSRSLADCPEGTLIRQATCYVERVRDKRAPVSVSGRFAAGERAFLYRSIILPLSADGVVIDSLLAGANFREITDV
ncbi:MAG: hypothetical protein WEC41_03905 [Dongiaceae bacterium]